MGAGHRGKGRVFFPLFHLLIFSIILTHHSLSVPLVPLVLAILRGPLGLLGPAVYYVRGEIFSKIRKNPINFLKLMFPSVCECCISSQKVNDSISILIVVRVLSCIFCPNRAIAAKKHYMSFITLITSGQHSLASLDPTGRFISWVL